MFRRWSSLMPYSRELFNYPLHSRENSTPNPKFFILGKNTVSNEREISDIYPEGMVSLLSSYEIFTSIKTRKQTDRMQVSVMQVSVHPLIIRISKTRLNFNLKRTSTSGEVWKWRVPWFDRRSWHIWLKRLQIPRFDDLISTWIRQ